MKIIELQCTTDTNGNLQIPRRVLLEMNIRPENQVRLAYLSDNNSINTYGEFMITPDGLTATLDKFGNEVNSVNIPTELLEAAGIPDDSDITITCENGEIVIREAGLFDSPSELSEMFRDLGISPENITVTYEGDKNHEQEQKETRI